jgi:hypothetical protein
MGFSLSPLGKAIAICMTYRQRPNNEDACHAPARSSMGCPHFLKRLLSYLDYSNNVSLVTRAVPSLSEPYRRATWRGKEQPTHLPLSIQIGRSSLARSVASAESTHVPRVTTTVPSCSEPCRHDTRKGTNDRGACHIRSRCRRSRSFFAHFGHTLDMEGTFP